MRSVKLIIGLVIAVIFIGGWIVGGLWMVGLGAGVLIAGLSSRPLDPIGVLFTLGLFASFCVPFAYLLYIVLSAKRKDAEKRREPRPPREEKPETGVGSEANRLREIRELREKERKKAQEDKESWRDREP